MTVLVFLVLHEHRYHILVQLDILLSILQQLLQLTILNGQKPNLVAILYLN